MDPKDEVNSTFRPSGVSRRQFIAALGATAAASTLLPQFARASENTVMYQDSYGNIVPASDDALSLGIFPPPIPNQNVPGAPDAARKRHRGAAHLEDEPEAGSYSQPNILVIMVDQLRAPRWLPNGVDVDTLLPNISYLRDHSISFNNYFVAATACTPSRATLLTGLYSQQTCMFKTQGQLVSQTPSLNIGFETIATVLGGSARLPVGSRYSCYWVGKWHLSDPAPSYPGTHPGGNGPVDYGFISTLPADNSPSFPPSSSYASPNGVGNLATEGYNPNGNPLNIGFPPNTVVPPYHYYDDAAIADWFTDYTLPLLNTSSPPWFATVSFVNPHDITAFPFAYRLTPTSVFANPASPSNYSYPAPNTAGASTGSNDTSLPPLGSAYTGSSAPLNWNYYDNPVSQIYNAATGTGKPGLQLAFQQNVEDSQNGAILGYNPTSPQSSSKTGWLEFMNYYYWMQSCVDAQIGTVLAAFYNSVSSAVWGETIIVFLSDHGDYGGSHWMHAKGGALYDESINVPLYISYGSQRPTAPPGPGGAYTSNSVHALNRTFVCSSVDVLPFLYATALGDDYNWRYQGSDNIQYLNGRESIMDAIFTYTTVRQRRLAPGIANNNGSYHNQSYQPYILHTTDELSSAFYNIGAGNVSVPSHAIAFRTVDLTVTQTNPDGFNVQGGGKLGMYSYWNVHATPPTQPDPTRNQQYEFYDYTAGNLGELDNDYGSGPLGAAYNSAFSAIAQGELYKVYAQFNSAYNAALIDYLASE